ncbi:MAG TPA: cupin domain-containing protein [Gammaproteobacteria bacterium]|nr:cupin domain-containing protein [Gammaproteobacteria bacterium]
MQDVNTDITQPARVDSRAREWIASPSPGVWRKPLYRTGGESGRATSIVVYEPGSRFPSHAHPEGEEILVLSGVFSDETGDYPAGSYLLNPPGSRHAPRTEDGCELFVKLRQYAGSGRRQVCIQTRSGEWGPGCAPGVEVLPLYRQHGFPEATALARLAAGSDTGTRDFAGGLELLVLSGSVDAGEGACGEGTWVRRPAGARVRLRSAEGCRLYLCAGALAGSDSVDVLPEWPLTEDPGRPGRQDPGRG